MPPRGQLKRNHVGDNFAFIDGSRRTPRQKKEKRIRAEWPRGYTDDAGAPGRSEYTGQGNTNGFFFFFFNKTKKMRRNVARLFKVSRTQRQRIQTTATTRPGC